MRKYFLFAVLALLSALVYNPSFQAQNNRNARQQNAAAERGANHDRIDSDKAKKMKEYFKNQGKPKEHEFTKFSREELIEVLSNMQGVDTVKFIMGAFMDDEGNGRKRGKPVIMLQVVENGREQPGGYWATYSYLQGAICPPPNGVCGLE